MKSSECGNNHNTLNDVHSIHKLNTINYYWQKYLIGSVLNDWTTRMEYRTGLLEWYSLFSKPISQVKYVLFAFSISVYIVRTLCYASPRPYCYVYINYIPLWSHSRLYFITGMAFLHSVTCIHCPCFIQSCIARPLFSCVGVDSHPNGLVTWN